MVMSFFSREIVLKYYIEEYRSVFFYYTEPGSVLSAMRLKFNEEFLKKWPIVINFYS